jgi:hypothetical protein
MATIMKQWALRGALTAVAVLLLGAPRASASTITYSADIFATSSTEDATPWLETVYLPNFDVTALSTPGNTAVLDSVVVTLDWNTTGAIYVENSDPTSAYAFTDASSSVPLTVTGPGSLDVNATAVAGPIDSATSTPSYTTASSASYGEEVPTALSITDYPPYCTVAHPCIVNGENDYTGLTGSGSSSGSPGALSAYEGSGSSDLTFTATAGGGTYAGTEQGGSGNLLFGGNASAGGAVDITYTYHEQLLPEPLTLFTVGSALIGLGLILQRKRKRA